MNFIHHSPNENDNIWPELMNTSRVTNRGGTYSSKSKSSNSSIFGNQDAWKKQDQRKMENTSIRLSENSLTIGINMRKNEPLSPICAAEDRTNKKSPIYKQMVFEEKKIQANKSLLYSQLSKRTFKQFQTKKRYSLFQQFPLRERNLFPIRQEVQNGLQIRNSTSSIDSNPQNHRFSDETDISSQ